MDKIAKLRQEMRELYEKVEGIKKLAGEEERSLTETEIDQMNGFLDDIETIQKEIAVEERMTKTTADLKSSQSDPTKPDVDGDGDGGDPDPTHEKRFATFGEFMMAVTNAGIPGGTIDQRLIDVRAASGVGEAVPSDGGFMVQKDFVDELLKRTYETGLLAGRTRRIPISRRSNGLKINAYAESSRADGSRLGGIRAYWADEAAALTGSAPKLRQIELTLHKLTGLCYATDELLEDSEAMESILMDGFAEEFGFKLDDALVNGDGAGKPLGILNADCLVTVNKETGQAAATVQVENIVKMWSRMWGRSRGNAVWMINQDIEPSLFTMSLAVGTGGVPVYMPANSLANSPYSTLMGRPLLPIEQCATLGTVGDIILGDFSQYVTADKGVMKSASSIHVRFLNDEMTYRFTYRIDGQPIWNAALIPYKGSNTLSPFIALQTRA